MQVSLRHYSTTTAAAAAADAFLCLLFVFLFSLLVSCGPSVLLHLIARRRFVVAQFSHTSIVAFGNVATTTLYNNIYTLY